MLPLGKELLRVPPQELSTRKCSSVMPPATQCARPQDQIHLCCKSADNQIMCQPHLSSMCVRSQNMSPQSPKKLRHAVSTLTMRLLWRTHPHSTLDFDNGAPVVDPRSSVPCIPQLQPGLYTRPFRLSLSSQIKSSHCVYLLKPKFPHPTPVHTSKCPSRAGKVMTRTPQHRSLSVLLCSKPACANSSPADSRALHLPFCPGRPPSQ